MKKKKEGLTEVASAQEERRKMLASAFRMPSPPTMVSRKSTLTNAFVCAIIPVVMPTIEEIEEALGILGMEHGEVRCVYCGEGSTEWDHLRPLVRGRRPTGYISEIGNLVPACGRCNSSKGGSEWEVWMRNERAAGSPVRRGVEDIEGKVERLRAYEKWGGVRAIDFEKLVGKVAWEGYWKRLEGVDRMLVECQEAAKEVVGKITKGRNAARGVMKLG